MTASLATSKQMLHSKAAFEFESSAESVLLSLLFSVAAAPSLFISSLSEVLELSLLLSVSFSLILGLAPPLSSFLIVFSVIWFLA